MKKEPASGFPQERLLTSDLSRGIAMFLPVAEGTQFWWDQLEFSTIIS